MLDSLAVGWSTIGSQNWSSLKIASFMEFLQFIASRHLPRKCPKQMFDTYRDQVLSPHRGQYDHARVEAVVLLVGHPVPGQPEGVVHGI